MSARVECGSVDSIKKTHFRRCSQLEYIFSSFRRPPWIQIQNSGLFAAPIWVLSQEPVRVRYGGI